jgi:uncharacterized protein involved in exopolysaccharide biosynthesis
MAKQPISRRRFWQAAHYWSIIRLRRRLVVVAFTLSVAAAVAYTWSRTWTYAATSVMRVNGIDRQGFDTNYLNDMKKRLIYEGSTRDNKF